MVAQLLPFGSALLAVPAWLLPLHAVPLLRLRDIRRGRPRRSAACPLSSLRGSPHLRACFILNSHRVRLCSPPSIPLSWGGWKGGEASPSRWVWGRGGPMAPVRALPTRGARRVSHFASTFVVVLCAVVGAASARGPWPCCIRSPISSDAFPS